MNTILAFRKNTVMMIVFWLTIITVSSFATVFRSELNPLTSQLMVIIFTYAATYMWFIEDAKQIGLIPSKALIIGVTTAASICIPYYLLRYKGLKRSLLSIIKFSLFFILAATMLGMITS